MAGYYSDPLEQMRADLAAGNWQGLTTYAQPPAPQPIGLAPPEMPAPEALGLGPQATGPEALADFGNMAPPPPSFVASLGQPAAPKVQGSHSAPAGAPVPQPSVDMSRFEVAPPEAAPQKPGVAPGGVRTLPGAQLGGNMQLQGGPQGTGNPILDSMIARANAPGRVVTTKGGWQPGQEVTKSALGPSDEAQGNLYNAQAGSAEVEQARALQRAAQHGAEASAMGTAKANAWEELDQRRAERTRHAEALEKGQLELSKERDAIAKERIDPRTSWEKMSGGQQVLSALALIGGEIGRALMRSDKNLAYEVLQDRINKSVEAQRVNIDNRMKALSAKERQTAGEIDRHNAATVDIEHETLSRNKLMVATLEQMKAEAKSDEEAMNIDGIAAQFSQKIAEQEAALSASRRGEVSSTRVYKPGGTQVVGGMNDAMRMKLIDAMQAQQKLGIDAKGKNGPQTVNLDGETVVINAGTEEGAAIRKDVAVLSTALGTIDKLTAQQGGVTANTLDGKTAGIMARTTAAALNKALGEGAMTADDEKSMSAKLTGMASGDARQFVRQFIEDSRRARIEQVAVGTLRKDGSVAPLPGRESLVR